MSTVEDIKIPNIGDFNGVEVIEVLVKPGDEIQVDDSLITLETEKATMDIPSPKVGVIHSVLIKVGDKVSIGDAIVKMSIANDHPSESEDKIDTSAPDIEIDTNMNEATDSSVPASINTGEEKEIDITLPESDDFKDVTVIEILVNPGDMVEKEQSLIALESEKASLELPSIAMGVIEEIYIQVGQKVNPGIKVLKMRTKEVSNIRKASDKPRDTKAASLPVVPPVAHVSPKEQYSDNTPSSGQVHAGPASRKMAHALGVDLTQVKGSGRKGRIVTKDIEQYVKSTLQNKSPVSTGTGIPVIPEQDFSQYGSIDVQLLSRIKKLTARNMLRNWLNIPHVTQFDEADISELEIFRKENKKAAQENGISLTPLSFIVKAVIAALKNYPQFNASLSGNGDELIYKQYYHIGVAVDTPNGLLVPVIKNADSKGLFEVAKEIGELSLKAKNGQLKASDMQGQTFTISSLGVLGGQQFTPIVNAPDVAILGVSKLQTKPVWKDNQFVPRSMLPLALSYDHRVIDGVEGAKFMTHLCASLQDIRKLLL